MRFRVLGAVELLSDDGRPIAVRSPNQRRVLASLLARPGEVVPFDALVEALWPDGPPPSVVTTLRTYVSRLRASTGEALVSRGGGYSLEVPEDDLDSRRFEALVAAAEHAAPEDAASLLQEGLALWTGPAFGADADLATVRAEAQRLEEHRGSARQALAAAWLVARRPDAATAAAAALVGDDPLREAAWAVLVRALADQGRTAEALRTYQRAVEALADAGLEPSPALRASERDVLDGTHDRPPSPSAAAAIQPAGSPATSRLPRRSSSFVGRADDLRHVEDHLARHRVVTLVGPGGVGKTRMAMETAARLEHAFGRGVVWVDLASLPPMPRWSTTSSLPSARVPVSRRAMSWPLRVRSTSSSSWTTPSTCSTRCATPSSSSSPAETGLASW